MQVVDEIECCFSVSSNNGFCAWWLSPSGENLLLRRRFLNKMDIFRCDGPREKTRRPLKIMYCCGDARDALERKQDRNSFFRKNLLCNMWNLEILSKIYISKVTNRLEAYCLRYKYCMLIQCFQLLFNYWAIDTFCDTSFL